MPTFDENMKEVFDLPDPEVIEAEEVKDIALFRADDPTDKQANEDYHEARKTMRTVIDFGLEAMDELNAVAKQSQAPRAFEVQAQLVKSVSEASARLLEVHQKLKDLRKNDEPARTVPDKVNNVMFVGSTADLQKMLREKMDQDVNE